MWSAVGAKGYSSLLCAFHLDANVILHLRLRLVRMAVLLGCALFFLVLSTPAHAANKSLKTRLGVRTQYDLSGERMTSQRYFLRQEAASLVYKRSTGLSFYSNFFLAVDTERDFEDSNERYTLRADSLYIEYQKSFLRLTAGMQQISWGETFGIPVIDIVNPIDITEPFSSDWNASKIAVPLATAEVIAGNLYLQGLFSPMTRRSPLPPDYLDTPIRELPPTRFGEDMEYGGRIGYLFPFGLDAKFLYYRHYNRIPRLVGSIDTRTGRPVLRATESLQHSFGLAASQAFDSLVIRFDGLYEQNTLEAVTAPASLPQARITDRMQAALGADWSSSQGDVLGLQLQGSQLVAQPDQKPYPESPASASGGTRSTTAQKDPDLWAGARIALHAFRERVSFDVFGLLGLNSDDWWLRPQLTLRLPPRLEWTTELNLMMADPNGGSEILAERRLVNSSLSYRF